MQVGIAKTQQLILDLEILAGVRWFVVGDGDSRARALHRRHYSCYHYKDGREPDLFVGPGEKMVLLTLASDALFAWRKFISRNGQRGVNCAVFRNESEHLSSSLILEAEQMAWQWWAAEICRR